MARLVLLNGPPGIGKTTLARYYLREHPLALHLDIDAIRCSMGQWEVHDRSKRLARALAVGMARTQLRAGFDVVVPQLIARVEFIEVLNDVAVQEEADFYEVLLLAPAEDIHERFRARNAAIVASGTDHPALTVDHTVETIGAISDELEFIRNTRERTLVIDVRSAGPDAAHRALRALLGET